MCPCSGTLAVWGCGEEKESRESCSDASPFTSTASGAPHNREMNEPRYIQHKAAEFHGPRQTFWLPFFPFPVH